MSEIKLRPCPFCGGKARIIKIAGKIHDGYEVTCDSEYGREGCD